MVQHLHSVFILRTLSQPLQHLDENRNIVALRNSVSIGINLESPGKSVCDEGIGVNYFVDVSDSGEVFNYKD